MKDSRRARTPRFHVACELSAGAELALPKDASRHLVGVLRGGVGDALCLFNGDGHDYAAELVEAGRSARVRILAASRNTTESPLETTLVQGISRGDRMDATVRQAVELGVTRIVPIQVRHGAIKLDAARAAKRHAHWQGIVVSACEQSGRACVPVLEPLVPYPEWLAAWSAAWSAARGAVPGAAPGAARDAGPPAATGVVLVPGAACRITDVPLASGAGVTLVIGPESGLSQAEADAAIAAGLHAASLGPRVLRTETAGPAALALMQSRHGDL